MPRSTAARGYGAQHQRERKRLIPIVFDEGARCMQAICLMPSRWMPPGTGPKLWDLGHNDDRTGWIGPCHVRCNRTAPQFSKGKAAPARAPRRWVL